MVVASSRSPATGWTPVVLVGLAFWVTMLGTTLPTPLYPALGARFGFGELGTTLVFATYPVAVTTALLVTGRWSDQLGRKPLLFAGLVLAALSSVVLALAPTLTWIFVGRVLSGLSAGIFTGTATATLVDLAPEGQHERTSLAAAAVNMGGLGSGPLLAGLLAVLAPWPLHLSFWVHVAMLGVAALAVALVVDPVPRRDHPDLRPQSVRVPAEVRPVFVRAAIAGFAGFAVLGLVGAVSPAFLGTVLGHHSPALAGVVAFSIFAASVAGQIGASFLGLQRALVVGCVGLIVGMALLGAALPLASLPLLVAGCLVTGVGQGLSFRAGLGAVTQASPAGQRGQVSSAFFVFLYVGIALPVVGEGLAATAFGLVPSGVAFSVLVGALALLVLVLLARGDRAVTAPRSS